MDDAQWQSSRGVKAWAIELAVVLLIGIGYTIWELRNERRASEPINQAETEIQKLRQGILAYPEVESRIWQTQTNKDPIALEERVYGELARQLGIDAPSLKETAQRTFESWKTAGNASALEKATAAYVTKNFAEAEKLAMQAADEAQKSGKSADVVRALKLAGLAAQRNTQYETAMNHFRAAEKLTDPQRDPQEWATVQEEIASVLSTQGHYAEEEQILQEVVQLRTQKFGAQERETLEARARLASATSQQTKYVEAEIEFRELIRLNEKLFGPEDPDTLWCRDSLAQTLMNQGKFGEAESEFRELLRLNEKILGAENPATLMVRNNLATAALRRGNHAEAKIEFTALMHLNEKLQGPEHPDTLLARYNLAVSLMTLSEYADAETELREVVRARTKALGAEHRDTLKARDVLAQALDKQNKTEEAEAEYREVLALCEKVLGADDPETIAACGALALILERRYHMHAAKAYADRALAGARKVFGRDHPRTKSLEDLVTAINSMMSLDRP